MTICLDQIDLFAADTTPIKSLNREPGSWTHFNEWNFNSTETADFIATLQVMPASVPPTIKQAFANAVNTFNDSYKGKANNIQPMTLFSDDDAHAMFRYITICHKALFDLADDEQTTFIKSLEQNKSNLAIRTFSRYSLAGCYSCGIVFENYAGIVIRAWNSNMISISLAPPTNPFFFESYIDDAPVFEIDSTFLKNTYSAQSLAEASGKTPTVNPISYLGRKYANTAETRPNGSRMVHAFELVGLYDWTFETHTRNELIHLWNIGARERGDMRGMVVQVGKERCVFSRRVCFLSAIDDGTNTDDNSLDDDDITLDDATDDDDNLVPDEM